MASQAKWPCDLGRPADPLENVTRARAQSILTQDGEPGPLLPYDQARDVVRWHDAGAQKPRQSARIFNLFARP